VWGQNIFAGLLYFCNDSSVSNMAECAGEFVSEAISDWSFVQPRVWANPATWSFDSFKDSLLILFEIISLEGWIDVMESVMQINGRNQQPQEYAQQWNALFFVGYNLLGAVFM
jgi:voltage-dependent calcium channel